VFDPDSAAVTDQWNYAYANHAATGITTTLGGLRFQMRYDAAGNMTSQTDHTKNLAKEMAYDSYNRILKVTDTATRTVKGEYWYDDQGFRVRKSARMTVDGVERQVDLLYPSMYYAMEMQSDNRGRPIRNTACGVNNIYLNGVRVAAALPDGQARYYLTDQVDSVKVVVDDRGMVLASHEYLPFGETWITEGDKKNAPKYNSQELDKESGYYYYNARYYDPEIGRFVTADSIVPYENETQSWNRFSYARNNPIMHKDPTGYFDMETGTIEKGDTLKGIRDQINNKFGTKLTLNQLSKGNNIKDPDMIYTGDHIKLPGENIGLSYNRAREQLTLKDQTYKIDLEKFKATSGRDGVTDSTKQDKGPIPGGNYSLDKNKIHENSTINKIGAKAYVSPDLGNYYTSLTPDKETQEKIKPRHGFMLHGGIRPGSAGCIDVGSNDTKLFDMIKQSKNDNGIVPVRVVPDERYDKKK
jgi:RHS repeat-associated protein